MPYARPCHRRHVSAAALTSSPSTAAGEAVTAIAARERTPDRRPRRGGRSLLLAAAAAALTSGAGIPFMNGAGAASAALASQPGTVSRSDSYVRQLNAPTARISEANRSYAVYFEAWQQIDTDDPQTPLGLSMPLVIGTSQMQDAVGWAGRPAQQEAVRILLEKRDRRSGSSEGRNATFREVFGLPYGAAELPLEMELSDFAVFIDDNLLYTADFAYLDKIEVLYQLLIAEAHRRAENGAPGEGVEPLLAAVRMARQVCDRSYTPEVKMGMAMLRNAAATARAYMWHYRENLAVNDYSTIATEFELLRPLQIPLPRANRLVGEQLVREVFDDATNLPNSSFATVMAEFESRDQPLYRFHASRHWREVVKAIDAYAGSDVSKKIYKPEIAQEMENIDQDFQRRWGLPLHDSFHNSETLLQRLDPVREAIVVATFSDLLQMRDLRLRTIADVRGAALAAGIGAFQKRDGGRAPLTLNQVYPTFVKLEETLVDPYNTSYEYFEYFVARRTDMRMIVWSFNVETPAGTLELPEGTPLLYSVGPNNRDDGAASHLENLSGTPDTDIIYWIPVNFIASDGAGDFVFQSRVPGARSGG